MADQVPQRETSADYELAQQSVRRVGVGSPRAQAITQWRLHLMARDLLERLDCDPLDFVVAAPQFLIPVAIFPKAVHGVLLPVWVQGKVRAAVFEGGLLQVVVEGWTVWRDALSAARAERLLNWLERSASPYWLRRGYRLAFRFTERAGSLVRIAFEKRVPDPAALAAEVQGLPHAPVVFVYPRVAAEVLDGTWTDDEEPPHLWLAPGDRGGDGGEPAEPTERLGSAGAQVDPPPDVALVTNDLLRDPACDPVCTEALAAQHPTAAPWGSSFVPACEDFVPTRRDQLAPNAYIIIDAKVMKIRQTRPAPDAEGCSASPESDTSNEDLECEQDLFGDTRDHSPKRPVVRLAHTTAESEVEPSTRRLDEPRGLRVVESREEPGDAP